jgi:hypothetical protein
VLAFAALMAWDNWRTGIRWESTGPQAGYFPFYVSLILAGACLWGLAVEFLAARQARRRSCAQPVRPRPAGLRPDAPLRAGHAVARHLRLELPADRGFMRWVGKLKLWIVDRHRARVRVAMFVTFDVAFDVIMPKGPLERLLGR